MEYYFSGENSLVNDSVLSGWAKLHFSPKKQVPEVSQYRHTRELKTQNVGGAGGLNGFKLQRRAASGGGGRCIEGFLVLGINFIQELMIKTHFNDVRRM